MKEDVQASTTKSLSAFGILGGFARELACNAELRSYFSEEEASYAQFACERLRQEMVMPTLELKIKVPILNLLPYSIQSSFMDKYFLGYDNVFTIRKVMIKEVVEQAIVQGATQVVVLAGGYDGRALFSSKKHEGVQFFEVDKGPTMELKKKILKSYLGESTVVEGDDYTYVSDNYKLGECDLTSDELPNTLENMGFNPDEKTLVIAEGFSTYIPKTANEQVLAQLKNTCLNPESEFLVSYGVDPKSKENEKALNANNEGHEFYIDFDDIPGFANENGWSVESRFSAETSSKLMESRLQTIYRSYRDIFELYLNLKPSDQKTQQLPMNQIPEMDLPAFRADSELVKQVARKNQQTTNGVVFGGPQADTYVPPDQDPSNRNKRPPCGIL